jgi:hypothetical protein
VESRLSLSAARALAERVTAELAREGAEAVALVGSHAEGTATEESDIDLAVIGQGPSYRLELHEGVLVSVGWASADEQRTRLDDPDWLATHVPGWRSAVLLHDPEGVGAEIRQLALDWEWSRVEARCDEWAASWLVGLAEEVQKIAGAVRNGDETAAAVQRSVLVLRLARVMAIRRRILYGTDNRLMDLVARAVGEQWRRLQTSALCVDGSDVATSCGSAIRLFELALNDVRDLLDDRQRDVVAHALALATRANPPSASSSPARGGQG